MENATKDPLVVLHEMDACTLQGKSESLTVTFLEFDSYIELTFEQMQKCIVENVNDLSGYLTDHMRELQNVIVGCLERFNGKPEELYVFKKSFNDEPGFMSVFVYNTKYKSWTKRPITSKQRLPFNRNQLLVAISN